MSDHPTIYELIGRIVDELPAIGKNQLNQQQGFKFRGIDDVLNELNPLLSKYGVFFAPDVLDRVAEQRPTQRGGVLHAIHLHVRYRFYGPSGDFVEASAWGEGTDSGDKATNKAMTSAMKYVLFQVFAISVEEVSNNDADRHTPEETIPEPEWHLPDGWESKEQYDSHVPALKDAASQLGDKQKALWTDWWKSANDGRSLRWDALSRKNYDKAITVLAGLEANARLEAASESEAGEEAEPQEQLV